MPDGGACLLDSNILLRISKSDDPQYAAISHALHALVGQGGTALLHLADAGRILERVGPRDRTRFPACGPSGVSVDSAFSIQPNFKRPDEQAESASSVGPRLLD